MFVTSSAKAQLRCQSAEDAAALIAGLYAALVSPAEKRVMRPISLPYILDFGGFDSSRILVLRGGILMSMGDVPDILSRQIFFVGPLGAHRATNNHHNPNA